jgi:hypothetical protein
LAITLTVNNIPFDYPENGENPPWGENATGWAAEVTKVLNSLKGTSDILETAAIIANNVTTLTDIPDFKFNPTIVRSFAVRGNIYRTSGAIELAEEFVLVGLRTSTGWILQQDGIGNSGVTFDITLQGQVQYKSSNLTSGLYSGLIKFRGIGILNS